MSRAVLSVGQCQYDHGRISRELAAAFDVRVDGVDTASQALAAAASQRYDLILINRVLDVDGSSGLELLRQLRELSEGASAAVMLVSNYPDAHDSAVALGGVRGFGKADLGMNVVRECVQPYLGDGGK